MRKFLRELWAARKRHWAAHTAIFLVVMALLRATGTLDGVPFARQVPAVFVVGIVTGLLVDRFLPPYDRPNRRR